MMELLSGSVDISERYFHFHLNRMVYYERNFLIMMICGILFTVISQLILVPIVFSVHRTNNKVLSLFAYIKKAEIHQLQIDCQEYLKQHIIDENDNFEYEFLKEEKEK